MAQTKTPPRSKKKLPAKKPAKKAPAKKQPSAAARKKAAEELALRRCWLAAGLGLLAFLGFLSFFSVRGFLVQGYQTAFRWLLGYGEEALPLCLLICAVLLVVKRRKRVRVQALCWGLCPLLFGAVRHVLSVSEGAEGLKPAALGASGMALTSGGVLSGGLAELLRSLLSTVGASILLCVLLLAAFLAGCHLTPERMKYALLRLKPLPEPEREPPAETPRPAAPSRPLRPVTPSGIDVALDDSPVSTRRPDPNREGPVAPPNVPTPADALRSLFHREKKPACDPAAQAEERKAAAAEEIFRAVEQNDAPAEPPCPAEPEAPQPAPETAPWEEAPAEPGSAPEDEPSVAEQIQQALDGGAQQPIYLYPPLRLLKPGVGKPAGSQEAIRRCAERLTDTLESFGVSATVIDTTEGPAVTRYELLLQRGIKFSKVVNLADDIALALGASGIRVSTIPDKNAVGVEVPNEQQEVVTARDIIGSPAFQTSKSKLSFAVGKDITGQPVVGNIAKMPHMLIAGTTGSGKSVCINSILISLLYKSTPEEVRLIMVDPKMIELGVYNGIPHLLIPVVTDPKKAAGALNWAVTEMMRRYKLFSQVGTRDLKGYNEEMERVISEGGEGEKLPQVVIIIDELSDLMAVARSEVEEAIIRLAQMARAAGMHLIIATQRPSADVITGLMKTNIPSRIAFAVASGVDSRIILDQQGAEKLLGKGDMLYFPLGLQKPQRVQGCFVSDAEVEEVVAFVKQCGTVEYDQEILDHIEKQAQQAEAAASSGGGLDEEGEDEKFDEAVEIVLESGQASVSMLQRRLKLGYSRAARLVDEMEDRGIVGPFEGSKPRPVLITRQEWQERMIRKREC